MIKAIIYDMDGLIIDSEPLWRRAEQEIFLSVGINLTDDMCRETMGMRIDEVIIYWYDRFPWPNPDFEQVEALIIQEICGLIEKEGKLLPGVLDSLAYFKERGLPLAIATSSKPKVVSAVLNTFDIAHYFRFVVSAANEKYGKPHPAIFLTTAKKLKTSTKNCLVLEDSFHGVIAALAAKMNVIAIPEIREQKFEIANAVLESLNELPESFEKLFQNG